MSSPRNTTADSPLERLMSSLPNGIEAQEAQGGREMANATTLPAEMRPGRAEFEALGFTFGEPVKGDDLFVHATLPEGWERQAHSALWTHIMDERGIRRVVMFYKAAFYDRRASMGLANVGADVVSEYVWGDQALFDPPTDLTDEERVEAVKTAHRYVEESTKRDDLVERAQVVLDHFDGGATR